MKWIEKYQLFLFDFDGLLVDTERLHFQAYQQMCLNRGFELNWDFIRFCQVAHHQATGLRDEIYAQFPILLQREPCWKVLYQEKKVIYERLLLQGSIELMPGVDRLLLALDQVGIKRCVVTNSARCQIEIILQHLPILKTIPCWITREDYKDPKPAPDGYLEAITRLKQVGDRVIGFEDSIKGLQSLLAAGVEGVLICPAYQRADTTLQVPYFPTFSDLINHFSQE